MGGALSVEQQGVGTLVNAIMYRALSQDSFCVIRFADIDHI